jgi:hypothetical protein
MEQFFKNQKLTRTKNNLLPKAKPAAMTIHYGLLFRERLRKKI